MTKTFHLQSLNHPSTRPPETFTEDNPPGWLLGGRPGSTIDNRWFFKDHVLTLGVGQSVDTDFSRITRTA